MKRRIISSLLCAAVAVTALAGCGGSGGGNGGGKGGDSTFAYLNSMPDVDLGGYNFVIAEAAYYGSEDRPNMEAGASDLSDAILARNKAIEEKFNCTISYEYYDPTSFYDEVYPIIMSGEKVADIMDTTLFSYGKFATAEYLYDMSTLPHVDFTQDHWLKVYDDTAVYHTGERYGASAMFANPYTHGFGLYFNKRLVDESGLLDTLGVESLYDLLEQNKWNWDTFGQMLSGGYVDVGSDGVFDNNDTYSITGGLDGGICALYLANGLNMLKVEDGYVKYAMTDPEVIPALTTMKGMFATPGIYYYGGGDSTECTKMFINGKVTFYLNLTTRGQALRDMNDDFGLLPLPIGPNATGYSSPIDHNTPIISVPSSIDNPEATGLILEALAATSYSEFDVWKDEVTSLYYRDEESADILLNYILPNLISDPVYIYDRIDQQLEAYTTNVIYKPIARDPNADPATMINSGKEVIQTLLDEVVNKNR